MMRSARALPTVPGTHGEYPAPHAVATTSAAWSAAARRELGALADELVSLHLDDANAGEPAGCETAIAQVHDAVDLGRLPRGSALPGKGWVLAGSVDQNVDHGAGERGISLPGETVLLPLHDRRALGRGLGRDLVRICGRRRALLRRVGEHAEAIEADVVEKLQEILERGVRFPREADQDRRPDGEAGNGLSEIANNALHALGRHRPAHGAQHAVVAVLHGDVEVRHHPGARPALDERLVDVGRMQVHWTDPGHARLAERQEEVADVAVARQVAPISERVLRDEDGFLHASRRQPLYFLDHVGQRPAPVTAPELRNRAEGAAHVASFGDLHVGVGDAARQEARRGRIVEITRRRRGGPVVAAGGLPDQVDDPREVRGAEDSVDLGHLAENVAAVALGEAAGDDERAARAALLQLGQLEDRVDRLLAGAVDEGARVDDDALGVFWGGRERKPGLGQHAEHELGIDLVLRAAERRQVDLHAGGSIPDKRGGLDAAVIRELERDAEVLVAQHRDDLLQIVAVLAGHADLVLLNRGLHPHLRILDEPHDLAGLLDRDSLLERDLLPEHAAA